LKAAGRCQAAPPGGAAFFIEIRREICHASESDYELQNL
jgi:hypothetical protein